MAIDRESLVRRHNPVLKAFDPFSVLSVGNGEFAFTADITGLQTFPDACEQGIPLCTMAQWGWHTTRPESDTDSEGAAPLEKPIGIAGPTATSFDSDLSGGNGHGGLTGDSGHEEAGDRRKDGTGARAAHADEPVYRVFDRQGLGLSPQFNGERDVYYASSGRGQQMLFDRLRQNPHRLHLGRIGLDLGADIGAGDIRNASQKLDLWKGHLASEFDHDGRRIRVETFCHPVRDILYFSVETVRTARRSVESPEGAGVPGILIVFPYGSPAKNAANRDYGGPRHRVVCRPFSESGTAEVRVYGFDFERHIDRDTVFARFESTVPCSISDESPTAWRIAFVGNGDVRAECAIAFSHDAFVNEASLPSSPEPGQFGKALPRYRDASAATAAYWKSFWTKGAAVDFGAVADPRAFELERRVVLSQYLCAIQCAGSLPPAETGLTLNSWYGKFHLEMHWWHGAHFALWGRSALFEKSLGFYRRILDSARERARFQGYRGARWPKMTDPEGRDSPSPIGPFLIWQQPHPIYYAELLYRDRRFRMEGAADTATRAVLDGYCDIVFETAEFMASYARYDHASDRYVLGPGLIPTQENHDPADVLNPALELAYWRFGLETAQLWRERMGLPRESAWQRVLDNLSPLPQKDGYYLSHENCPDSYGHFAKDHPEMLAASGMLPGTMTDVAVMRRSFDRVLRDWDMESLWGWDFPLMAMCAARLGDGEAAVNVLLMDTPKNVYLPNGHNRQTGSEPLPLYLPGNGGLLMAVAMMAAGWDGCGPQRNPGFPKDWDIRWEGLSCMP